ncbi:MAG: HAD family phosphatase [Burkholderiaceae bacterium]
MIQTACDGIVFDCDGVLVDSEPISCRVLCEMLNELGVRIDVETTVRTFVGKPVRQELDIIEQLTGRPLPPDWYEGFVIRRNERLADEIVAIRGIDTVLGHLATEGIPFAVASGADRTKMRLMLGVCGLATRFGDRLFGADMVANPKPAPDVYQMAIAALGIEPARTVVVEDTPTGVRAGVAAGAVVLGYCERNPAGELLAAGASAVFHDMRRLPRLLGLA